MGALVGEPVSLFKREVPTPVGDFHVAFQERGVDERSGEFVAYAGGFEGAGRDGVVVGTVGEGAALAFWRAAGGVGDVCGGEFKLRFLLEGRVGRGGVGAEGVEEILLLVLLDLEGKRLQGGEDMVGYGECELRFWGEGLGEGDAEELGWTKEGGLAIERCSKNWKILSHTCRDRIR